MPHSTACEPTSSAKTHLLPNSPPLVSVISPCFNHSAFVIEALDSVRLQTYSNIQLIIIDDCSSDHSKQLIQDWIARHQILCTFIAHETNQGIIKTLNEALSLARGKYIACLPSDDRWLLDKLECQVSQMEQLPESVGVLYSDSYRIDPKGHQLNKLFIENYRTFSTPPTGDIFLYLLRGNFIPATTTLVRRSCYEKVGLYDESLCYEDWDMWLRMASKYDFVFSNKISAYYRVVPSSLSHVLFTAKNLKVTLSNFKILLKYRTEPKLGKEDQKYLADLLTALAYELNNLNYKKRSACLYQAWQYNFRKQTFIFWLCACLKLPPSSGNKLYNGLAKLKKWLK